MRKRQNTPKRPYRLRPPTVKIFAFMYQTVTAQLNKEHFTASQYSKRTYRSRIIARKTDKHYEIDCHQGDYGYFENEEF